MTALYQNRQIRDLELQLISSHSMKKPLMQAAGDAAWHVLQQFWPEAESVTVCCGGGNNGGDGYTVALLAQQAGLDVSIFSLTPIDQLKGEARQAADACLAVKIPSIEYHPDIIIEGDVIVDALLGIGLDGEVKEPYSPIIDAINASDSPVLSIDIPSGLNSDTGQVLGCAVQADVTVTFIGLKQGLYTNKGPAYSGEIILKTLGNSGVDYQQIKPSADLLDWLSVQRCLPKRKRDTYKGSYGHVLVIGGDYGMGGAVRMSAEAAMRVGAGLVSVATRPEHVTVVNCSRPEIMCHQVNSADDVLPLLDRATVIVIGPGLGKSEWAVDLLTAVLSCDKPKIMDADALNLLSKQPAHRNDWILTPHPGEASRLLDSSCQVVQDDRFSAVDALQTKYGGIAVLKGVGTLIKGENEAIGVCPAGNPGMATGGMGDILSGVIGGLLAQHISLLEAANAGVLVHSIAADIAAQEGGERGLLATDLLSHLRELVNPDVHR